MKFVAAGVALCLVALVAFSTAESEFSHGFGTYINWVDPAQAESIAKSTGKPIMHLIHKSWCGACKRLKSQFGGQEAAQVNLLSEKFVMVNYEDDQEPKGKDYGPDGTYIPRIVFADSSGRVDTSIYNEFGNAQYKYFYSSPAQVATAMQTALDKLAGGQDDAAEHAEL